MLTALKYRLVLICCVCLIQPQHSLITSELTWQPRQPRNWRNTLLCHHNSQVCIQQFIAKENSIMLDALSYFDEPQAAPTVPSLAAAHPYG